MICTYVDTMNKIGKTHHHHFKSVPKSTTQHFSLFSGTHQTILLCTRTPSMGWVSWGHTQWQFVFWFSSVFLDLAPKVSDDLLPQDKNEFDPVYFPQVLHGNSLSANLKGRMNHWVGCLPTLQAGIQTQAHGFIARHANQYTTVTLMKYGAFTCKMSVIANYVVTDL